MSVLTYKATHQDAEVACQGILVPFRNIDRCGVTAAIECYARTLNTGKQLMHGV